MRLSNPKFGESAKKDGGRVKLCPLTAPNADLAEVLHWRAMNEHNEKGERC
jgi:hypothetical protein